MRMWYVETKEIEGKSLLSNVFDSFHFSANTFKEAFAKAENKIREDHEGMTLEITKIEELYDIDE